MVKKWLETVGVLCVVMDFIQQNSQDVYSRQPGRCLLYFQLLFTSGK